MDEFILHLLSTGTVQPLAAGNLKIEPDKHNFYCLDAKRFSNWKSKLAKSFSLSDLKKCL